jgi:hypothetical protein
MPITVEIPITEIMMMAPRLNRMCWTSNSDKYARLSISVLKISFIIAARF